MFDPLRVKNVSEEATMIQADHLLRFGFPEFTHEFIVGLKKEIPRYRRMARAHFDWNSLDGGSNTIKISGNIRQEAGRVRGGLCLCRQ